jgi:hypothetical protein
MAHCFESQVLTWLFHKDGMDVRLPRLDLQIEGGNYLIHLYLITMKEMVGFEDIRMYGDFLELSC